MQRIFLIGTSIIAVVFTCLYCFSRHKECQFSAGAAPPDKLLIASKSDIVFTSNLLKCAIFSDTKDRLMEILKDPNYSGTCYSLDAKKNSLGSSIVFTEGQNWAITEYEDPVLPNEELTKIAPKLRTYWFVMSKKSRGERRDQIVYFFEHNGHPDSGDYIICW